MNRVYIWGTGAVAYHLMKHMDLDTVCGFIETKKTKDSYLEKKVFSCKELPLDYDAIIVATVYTEAVYETAQREGLDTSKMIFFRKCFFERAEEKLTWKREVLGEINYELYINEYRLYEESFFKRDKIRYNSLNTRKNFIARDENDWPVIRDKFAEAGSINNYFWQDLWAARLIHQNLPEVHYDIGSRLDGFIAHVLSFGIPVKMIDIRPFPEEVEGLDTIVGDATDLLEFADDSIESLSALCSIEHFGLGRYGDPIDPEACFKCFKAIQRKLKPGGNLYLSLPIGKERVEFNAHRVFYASTVVECFDDLRLLEFSCTAVRKLEKNVEMNRYDNDSHNGEYRYGLFHFCKEIG